MPRPKPIKDLDFLKDGKIQSNTNSLMINLMDINKIKSVNMQFQELKHNN